MSLGGIQCLGTKYLATCTAPVRSFIDHPGMLHDMLHRLRLLFYTILLYLYGYVFYKAFLLECRTTSQSSIFKAIFVIQCNASPGGNIVLSVLPPCKCGFVAFCDKAKPWGFNSSFGHSWQGITEIRQRLDHNIVDVESLNI